MKLGCRGFYFAFADKFTDVRDGHRGQDTQDGYHDQQLDQGEALLSILEALGILFSMSNCPFISPNLR